jgi:hypothetical protein
MSFRAGVLVAFCVFGSFTSTQVEATENLPLVGKSSEPITPQEFEKLHKLIKPQADEWQFADVPWIPTIAEARVKAAKEGKPLLIWYMVGEPLGQC